MMLGKRGRPPLKRTTSMSEITFDLTTHPKHPLSPPPSSFSDQSRTVSPRNNNSQHHRKQISVDSEQQQPDFLLACSLCKRRLVPGRDIYMYRGDSGFCSQECREKQMKQDEKRKDKCGVASNKQVLTTPPSGSQLATT